MDLQIQVVPKTPPRLREDDHEDRDEEYNDQLLTPPPSSSKISKRFLLFEESHEHQESKRICSPKNGSFFEDGSDSPYSSQLSADAEILHHSVQIIESESSSYQAMESEHNAHGHEELSAVFEVKEAILSAEDDEQTQAHVQVPATDAAHEVTEPNHVTELVAYDEAIATGGAVEDGEAVPVKDPTIDFMGLPKCVRDQIYRLLLVVPAIVSPRQRRTASHEDYRALLHTEELRLLPGISFVLTQTTSDGFKKPFCRFPLINSGILLASKKVHTEATKIMYGENKFDLANLTLETAPPADFKCRLFPRSYQAMIRNITLRGNTVYRFRYILTTGLKDMRTAYRLLSRLTLALELPSTHKGWAKAYSRAHGEKYTAWIKRLRDSIAMDIYGCEGVLKTIPVWIDLKVIFEGENYISSSETTDEEMKALVQKFDPDMDDEDVEEEVRKRMALKKGLPQAFELFKRGYRH